MRLECTSCAGTEADGAVFLRPGGNVCTDCVAEQDRRHTLLVLNAGVPLKKRRIQTRASYRAKLRVRSLASQFDLVDLVVGAP